MPPKKPGGAGSNSSMPPAATSKALLEKCQQCWRDMQKGKTLEANYAAIKSVAEAQPSGPLLVHLARASLYMALHEMESEFGVDSAFEKINPLVFPRGAPSLKDRPHLDAAVVACQQGALQHRSLACAVFYAKLARGHGQLEALPHLRRMADSREFGWASWRDPLEDDPDNEAFKGKKNKMDRVLAGMVQLGKVVKDMDGSARSFGRWAEQRARAVLQELLDPAEGQLAAPLLSKALLQKAVQKFNNAPKQLKELTGEEIEAEMQEQARMREGERHRGPRSQSDKSRQDQQERNEAARLQVVVKKAEQKLKEHAKTWAELGTKVSAFLPAKLAEAGPEGSPVQIEALLALCPVSKEELLKAMRSHPALQAAKLRGTPDEGVYACLEKRLLPIILQTKGWESWMYTDASGGAQYFSSGDALLKHWAAVVDWGSDESGVTSTELWQAYFDGIGVWQHPLPPALPSSASEAPSAVSTAEESRAAGETLLLEPFLTGLEARALLQQASKHDAHTKYMPLGVPPGVRSHAADILTRWLGPPQHNEEMQLGDPFLQYWKQLDQARRQIMTQLARRLDEQAGRKTSEVMTVHFHNKEENAALASLDASHGELVLWLARELASGNALVVNQLIIAIEDATQLRQPAMQFVDALEAEDDVAAADATDTPPVDAVTVVDLLRRQRFANCAAGTQVVLHWRGGPDPTVEEINQLQEQASQLTAMSRKGELDAVAGALNALQAGVAAHHAALAAAPDAEGAADALRDPAAQPRDASAPGLSRRSSGESPVAKAAEQDLEAAAAAWEARVRELLAPAQASFKEREDHLPADADAPCTLDRKTIPRTACSTPGEALSHASSSGDRPGEAHGSSSTLESPMQSVSKPGISPCTGSSLLPKQVLLGDIQLALRLLQDSRMLTEAFMRSVGVFMRQHLPAADSADVHLGSLGKLPTERLHEVHQAVAAELAIHGQQLKVVQGAFAFIAGKSKLFEQPGTLCIHEDESFCYNAAAILGLSQPPAPACTDPTCTTHHHAAESSAQTPESALTAARLQNLLKHMLSLEEAVVPPEGDAPAEAAARQQLHKAGNLLRQALCCRPQAQQFKQAIQEACELFSALLSEQEVLRGGAGGVPALRDWVSLAKRAWEVRTGLYKVYYTAVKQEAERDVQRAELEFKQESRELVRKLKELEQQLMHLQRIGKGSSELAGRTFGQSQQVKMQLVHLKSIVERETDSHQRAVCDALAIQAVDFVLTEDEEKARDTISKAYNWLFSGMGSAEDRQAMEDLGLVSSVRRALHVVVGTTNRMLQKVRGLHVDLTRQMGIYYTLATEIMRMAVNASAVNALDEFLPYYNYALVEKLAKMADVYLEKKQAALADAFLAEVSVPTGTTSAGGGGAPGQRTGSKRKKAKARPQSAEDRGESEQGMAKGQSAATAATAASATARADVDAGEAPAADGAAGGRMADEDLKAKLVDGSLTHLDFQPDFSDLDLGEHADLDAYLASRTPSQLKKWKRKKSARQQEMLQQFKQAHAHLVPPVSLPHQAGDQASREAFAASASAAHPDGSVDDGWQSVQKPRAQGGRQAARPEAARHDRDQERGWEQHRRSHAAKVLPPKRYGPSHPDVLPCDTCGKVGHLQRECPEQTCATCSGRGHHATRCGHQNGDQARRDTLAAQASSSSMAATGVGPLPPPFTRSGSRAGVSNTSADSEDSRLQARRHGHAAHGSAVEKTEQMQREAAGQGHQEHSRPRHQPERGAGRRCINCGLQGHTGKDCPHPHKSCQLCGMPTHQAVVCSLWQVAGRPQEPASGIAATRLPDKPQVQDRAQPADGVRQHPAQLAGSSHTQSSFAKADAVSSTAAARQTPASQHSAPASMPAQPAQPTSSRITASSHHVVQRSTYLPRSLQPAAQDDFDSLLGSLLADPGPSSLHTGAIEPGARDMGCALGQPLHPPQHRQHEVLQLHHPTEAAAAAEPIKGPVDEETVNDLIHCPITMEIMRDPVLAADGYTYERSAIEKWLRTSNTSPQTNMLLEDKHLRPNNSIRIMCRAVLSAQKLG